MESINYLGNCREKFHITPVIEKTSKKALAAQKVAIIGGGPAGFFAAIKCAEDNKKTIITIFEASNHPLEKIRLSGGGRCNVTHSCFDPKELIKNYPRGSKELLGPFYHFQPSDMIDWLNQRGVELKTEEDGRIFPVTDSSMTILNCLKDEAIKNRIQIKINTPVNKVEFDAEHKQYVLSTGPERSERFDKLLIATGSSKQGYKLTTNLGHTIVDPVPSLFTFKIKDQRLDGLSGLSFPDTAITLLAEKKLITRGPMLITHWGLSGPAILKLSAFGARKLNECSYQTKISINFAPELNGTDLLAKIETVKKSEAKKFIRSTPLFGLPRHYWHSLLEYINLPDNMTWANLTKELANSIVNQVCTAEFDVLGKGIFKEEFVTCGGVSLKEINFKTMGSKLCPNLYFAGEVLDIDGITGGFNFQNAWTTGWIAGASMAQ